MKLLQYSGPFSANQRIDVPAEYGYRYVHIGIQSPKNGHVGYIYQPLTPIIKIIGTETTSDYVLNYNNILEFDNLQESNITIQILKALPAETIIDIAYFEED